ncbi:MAG: hypothetical protein M1812_006783 [Candelaria pacifica]|nr:MAG: hypothetical protein M1812_006783 [Candelaria pacifica]
MATHRGEKSEPGNPISGQQADEENSNVTSQDDSKFGDESPIVYHYLTFETELPSPSMLLAPDSALPSTLDPPDLTPFQSPFDWSDSRKTFITWLSCTITAVTAYTAGSYSPAVPQMSAEWGVSEVAVLVGITTFCTGFATAPMVLAPFSEINGRKPVFIVTGILFVGMLVARFGAGVGGSTFSTMVGGVVSDIYHAEDRNTPMALFSGAALAGTGLGPLCSSFIAQHLSWRWVFYLQTIDGGLLILAVILFFKETRGSVLLSKKAKVLNSWYEARENAGYLGLTMPAGTGTEKKTIQRLRWKVKSDEERDTIMVMIGISLVRPFREYD